MAPSVSPVITSPFAENAMHDTYFGLWFFCLNRIRKGYKVNQSKMEILNVAYNGGVLDSGSSAGQSHCVLMFG